MDGEGVKKNPDAEGNLNLEGSGSESGSGSVVDCRQAGMVQETGERMNF